MKSKLTLLVLLGLCIIQVGCGSSSDTVVSTPVVPISSSPEPVSSGTQPPQNQHPPTNTPSPQPSTSDPGTVNNPPPSSDPGITNPPPPTDPIPPPVQPPPAPPVQIVTLTWIPPTENTDGTPLTNLAGYYILYGTSQDALTQTIKIDNAGLTSYVIDNLTAGTYYFAMRAFTSTGEQSDNSNIASKTIN